MSRHPGIPAILCIQMLTVTACATAQSRDVTGDARKADFEQLHPIDEEGVFWIPKQKGMMGEHPFPSPNRAMGDILEDRAPSPPVRCRLVDYVDCSKKTHHFRERSERGEGGPSHVAEILGKKFRVTGLPLQEDNGGYNRWVPMFFEYRMKTNNRAATPHLIVYEIPNDRERYTTVSLTVPDGVGKGQPWAPPYTGQEAVEVDAMHISQEPFWYEPDVGICIYTGRDVPVDNQTHLQHFVFFAKSAEIDVRVSSSALMEEVNEMTGAAVSNIWIFEILDPLDAAFPKIERPKDAPERKFGIYTTHPWYYLAHYGAPPHNVKQRRVSLQNLCDLVAFCGMNVIQFNAINGSDRAGRAWYPGSYYSQLGADLLSELPPVAKKRDIEVIPIVTSITAPRMSGNQKFGFSEDSFQKHYNPKADPRAFENRPPDPLRPEVQAWLTRHVMEIARRVKRHDNVPGVGFRVNGKFGFCYIAGEDKSSGQTRVFPAREMGYSRWNLEQFREESGLDVPMDSMKAYTWLQEDPDRWEAWLDFRCRRIHDYWLELRDMLKEVRPDFTLYISTVLPSEVLATNVLWPGKDAPEAERERITLELLREHGYDPRLYKDDEGLIIQRTMMVDSDRIHSTRWGPPWGSNPIRYRDFHEQDFLASWYRTPGGAAVELYHSYWEEPFHPDIWEFGPDSRGPNSGMRTATSSAIGREFYRPMTFSLATSRDEMIVLNGWERPVLGHEHSLRAMAQAYRALPAQAPLAVVEAGGGLQIARYGDRLALIHHARGNRTVRIPLNPPLPKGQRLRDAATQEIFLDVDSSQRDAFTIDLQGYDLRTLVLESISP